MVSLLCHLHFWTLKPLSPGTASGADIGTHVYHEKTAATEGLLNASRKEWAQGRGIMWVPNNKKPEKLRDTLRECEELLVTHQPVAMKWKTLRHCLVLLDNGVLITYSLVKHSGDIERIFLDKSLVARLGAKVDNALVMGGSLVLTTTGDSRLAHVCLGSRSVSSTCHNPLALTLSDSGRKLEKLSAQDLKVVYLEVAGMPTGQVQRHLVCNRKGDLVVVWWRDRQDGGWTWSSMANGGVDNLFTFSFTKNGKLQYSSSLQTDHDPISMTFSKSRSHVLYSLEKTGRTEYTPSTYEFADNKMSKVSTGSAITSSSNVTVSARNRNECLLLLGCENGSMILYDSASPQGQVNKTRAFFSPISMVQWHPAGMLAFVCSPTGEVQCYDVGLNPLLFQTLSEDPTPSALLNMGQYFVAPVHLKNIGWGSEQEKGEGHGGCYDNFMMVFGSGPMVMLRLELGVLSRGNLGPVEVVAEYVRLDQIDKAISILERLNWNYQQTDCFSCLTIILNYLLVQPLTSLTEGQIDTALNTFLGCADTQTIPSLIWNRYKPHVVHLQRRFFHLLFRHKKLEKAYEVAKCIQAKDLFMDIHFLALDLREVEIAERAHQSAEGLFSETAVDSTMPWFGQMMYSSSGGPSPFDSSPIKSSTSSYASPYHQLGATGSEEDLKDPPFASSILSFEDDIMQVLHASSILSFEDSLGSYSPSPLAEQAVPFHSDNSATPSHSEMEDCSDNEGTQEASVTQEDT